jgi:hypothetical protein
VRNGGTEDLPNGRLEWITQFNSTGSSGQRAVGLFREMKGQFGFSIRHGSPNSVHSLPRCETLRQTRIPRRHFDFLTAHSVSKIIPGAIVNNCLVPVGEFRSVARLTSSSRA